MNINLTYIKGISSSDTPYFERYEDQVAYFINLNHVTIDVAYFPPRYSDVIKIESSIIDDNMEGNFNYLFFEFRNVVYYYFVKNITYVNQDLYEIEIVLDTIQTFMFYLNMKSALVERCHINRYTDYENKIINRNYIRDNFSKADYISQGRNILERYSRGLTYDECFDDEGKYIGPWVVAVMSAITVDNYPTGASVVSQKFALFSKAGGAIVDGCCLFAPLYMLGYDFYIHALDTENNYMSNAVDNNGRLSYLIDFASHPDIYSLIKSPYVNNIHIVRNLDKDEMYSYFRWDRTNSRWEYRMYASDTANKITIINTGVTREYLVRGRIAAGPCMSIPMMFKANLVSELRHDIDGHSINIIFATGRYTKSYDLTSLLPKYVRDIKPLPQGTPFRINTRPIGGYTYDVPAMLDENYIHLLFGTNNNACDYPLHKLSKIGLYGTTVTDIINSTYLYDVSTEALADDLDLNKYGSYVVDANPINYTMLNDPYEQYVSNNRNRWSVAATHDVIKWAAITSKAGISAYFDNKAISRQEQNILKNKRAYTKKGNLRASTLHRISDLESKREGLGGDSLASAIGQIDTGSGYDVYYTEKNLMYSPVSVSATGDYYNTSIISSLYCEWFIVEDYEYCCWQYHMYGYKTNKYMIFDYDVDTRNVFYYFQNRYYFNYVKLDKAIFEIEEVAYDLDIKQDIEDRLYGGIRLWNIFSNDNENYIQKYIDTDNTELDRITGGD